jgi:hypothetical protein
MYPFRATRMDVVTPKKLKRKVASEDVDKLELWCSAGVILVEHRLVVP